MAATSKLAPGLLLLLGLAPLHSAVRVDDLATSEGKLVPSSFANSTRDDDEEWLLGGTYACCCKAMAAEKCKYRVADFSGLGDQSGSVRCCKLRKKSCPMFSHYDTLYASRCWQGVPQDLEAHPNYKLMSPETAEPLPRGGEPTPLSTETIEGQPAQVYLAQARTSEKLLTVTRTDSDRALAVMQKACSGAKTAQKSILPAEQAPHLARCVEFDEAMQLMVMEYSGKPSIEAMPWTSSQDLLGLLKQVFLGLHALARAEPAQVHRDLRWGTVAVDENKCLKITDLGEVVSTGENKRLQVATSYTAPECYEKGCTASPAMDAYSAGVMAAVSLCGAPEYFIYDGAKNDRLHMIYEVEQQMKNFGRTELAALYAYGMRRARKAVLKLTMGRQVEFLQAQSVDPNFLLRSPFEEKLRSCKAWLKNGRLRVIDHLMSSGPGDRPSPQDVLLSPLFSDVNTGCGSEAGEGEPVFKAWGSKARPTKMTMQLLPPVFKEARVRDVDVFKAKATEYVQSVGTDFKKKKNPLVREGYLEMMRSVVDWEEEDIQCVIYNVMKQLKKAIPDEQKASFYRFNLMYFHPDKAPRDEPKTIDAYSAAFKEVQMFDTETFRHTARNSPCD